ncbi:MAG: alpha/beta hydrolase [Akkermansiaceae bacterium]|nr:alpha/beta hydrolase [Akkermansiaceae bacterium]
MKFHPSLVPLCTVLLASGCVSPSSSTDAPHPKPAAKILKDASKPGFSSEERAALYLKAAQEAAGAPGHLASSDADRRVYNQAAADLTTLLRETNQGGLWNRPLTLRTGDATYRLRYAKAADGIWDPAFFTAFKPASEVKQKSIKRKNFEQGVGGALVGIRKKSPLEPFSPMVGITAPVTAVLDFKGQDVTLTLVDPTEKTKARVDGVESKVAADYSAPLAYYPQKSETWEGLMGAIRVSQYMKTTGLYMLQPYDPDRIPLIFVHGLISTPRMWRNVINELETDPELRRRYQCWVFAYPTGNPPAYSALRFREELAKVHQLYPKAKDYVLVGHSMGGLISRMQATSLDRESWNAIGEDKASQFFSRVKKGSLVHRAVVFDANPKIDRVIFICTPHRGSEMAISSIGELGMRLISLPADLAGSVISTVGTSMSLVTGSDRVPNSVSGLSPRNPTLKVLDAHPIEAPHHSIIGDRGRGDTPKSSDGVVEYWSSKQKRAKSEKIVPGPHGACELPETLDELRRLLHLHLKETGNR